MKNCYNFDLFISVTNLFKINYFKTSNKISYIYNIHSLWVLHIILRKDRIVKFLFRKILEILDLSEEGLEMLVPEEFPIESWKWAEEIFVTGGLENEIVSWFNLTRFTS